MKILVTHEFPHLDDIAAIWLWKKYVPGFAKAKVEFVRLKGGGEAVTYKNKPVDSNPDVIHFGVGKGKFDEHKGDIGVSATLLTFRALKKYIPKRELLSVQHFVDFVNAEDTGQTKSLKYPAMHVPVLLRNIQDSHKRYQVGAQMIELAMITFENEALLEKDWAKRTEFQSQWGKAVLFKTAANGADWFGYTHGFDLVVHVDPVKKWKMFHAKAESSIDFRPAYEKIKALEPKASWFLHHSHHMLMCGSRSAPDVVRSKLSDAVLMQVVAK